MSRIGKQAIEVPGGVEVKVDGQHLGAKGPKGELSVHLLDDIAIEVEDNLIKVKPANDGKRARSMWGMQRTLVANAVEGVVNGFEKKLEINGVGYRAQMKGSALNLQLGYSHDINYPVPAGISVACPDQTTIIVSGIDKQKVGQVAAEIREFRKPEPYKGKGVKYAGEYIFRKEGKKK